MKVLVIGSGGREHALCWKLKASPLLTQLYCAPGNAGIGQVATRVNIKVDDVEGIVDFCCQENIDLVIPGPEVPLVKGLVEALAKVKIKAFGPTAAAAQLESSKGFTKDLCKKYHIPTAAYERFDNLVAAKKYIADQGAPIVIKADGLAAGKGVVVAMTESEAIAAVDDMLGQNIFGHDKPSIVIEEFLTGEEASFFVLVDGESAVPLVPCQDHKRVFDGDQGPNTGGMGAYAPTTIVTDQLCDDAMQKIIYPTIEGMKKDGTPFTGILFAGLMLTKDGPKLIEYNVRFGDPECQVLMMLMDSDLLSVLVAASRNELNSIDMKWKPQTAITVVMAAKGYPGEYVKNTVIRGLGDAEQMEGVKVFHAGTEIKDKVIVNTGGRVLNITAIGEDLQEAQTRAYAAIKKIDWAEGFCRSDIGWRELQRKT